MYFPQNRGKGNINLLMSVRALVRSWLWPHGFLWNL